jgi:hypothetical protein
MCYDVRKRGHRSHGRKVRRKYIEGKIKRNEGKDWRRGTRTAMKKRGIKQKGNGATDLDTACRDADGTESNCTLRERAARSGPGRVPRARADGEGRTANVMQSDLRRQGLKVRRYAATVRCWDERVLGRREYGGERTGEGAEMNRIKSELNRK